MNYKGKSVLLIGAAPDLETNKDPKDYDIIVRINKSIPIHTSIQDITSDRCDVLYIYFSLIPRKEWRVIRELRVRLNERRHGRTHTVFNKFGSHCDNIKIIPHEFCKDLDKKIGCKANTGILAIHEILIDKPKELFITGITFYKTGFHEHYGEDESRRKMVLKSNGNVFEHNQDKQLKYFVDNFYRKRNVKCDSSLKKICKDYIKSEKENA